ncbi:MAG: C-terminal helicase domain-containing protein [Vicinamibacterales bacterium]
MVCAFTSEQFYEGRLEPRPGLERLGLSGTGVHDGAGLFWLPVAHTANRNWSAEEIEVVDGLVARLLAPGVSWTDGDGVARPLTAADLLVVAPYNAHVNRLAERLAPRGIRVGTVDKFQGQEAPVVVFAMASSSPDDAPRGMEFLYSRHRLNVATSRAKCAAFVVASPALLEPECRTPRQMALANALCRFVELAGCAAATRRDHATACDRAAPYDTGRRACCAAVTVGGRASRSGPCVDGHGAPGLTTSNSMGGAPG